MENVPPPPAPEPMAPPSPMGGTPPIDDPMAMGDAPMPSDEDMPMDDEMPMGDDMPMDDEPIDAGMEPEGDEGRMPGSFRLVQKLLGKVTQKMRDLSDEGKLTDKNIKYVINTVLSAVDLSEL